MPDENLIKLKKETYLKAIHNSPGTRIFNSLSVKNKQTEQIYDVLEDGKLSCAVFVSGVLSFLGMLDRPHATTTTLKEKLVKWGFTEVGEDDYEEGDVLIYEEVEFEDGTKSDHSGFYIGNEKAVSVSFKEKMVVEHNYTFGEKDGEPMRRIVQAYRPNYGDNEIKYERS